MTRGYYRMPSDSIYLWPERWDKPFFDDSFSCSSYDNCHAPWGNTHEGTMRHVENNKFIMGQFVGARLPTILASPLHSAGLHAAPTSGIVDLAGFPKRRVLYVPEPLASRKDSASPVSRTGTGRKAARSTSGHTTINADEVELLSTESPKECAGPTRHRTTPRGV